MLRRSPQTDPDPGSTKLLAELRAHGLNARLAASACCGERDVRICVERGPLDPSVELLCCTAGDPQPPQWHAVRLTGEERTVWRGPDCRDEVEVAVAFVEDLLVLGEAALAERYRRLG